MRPLKQRGRTAIIAVAVVAASSVLTSAAPGAAKPAAGGVTPQSGGCFATITNAGPPTMTVCISGHGNVHQISYNASGAPVDHVFGSAEGYCLSDIDNSFANYYDAGATESGWGVATTSQATPTTLAVTRTTSNGRFTLTQNFFFKYGSRLLLVGNVVKNNGAVARHIFFGRSFDGDIDGDASDDVWDVAGSSVFAQDVNGLALTALSSFAIGWGPWNTNALSSCGINPPPTPVTGDYAGTIIHEATIAPGATVNFRVGYRLL